MGRLRKPAPLAPGCPDRRTMPHSWEMDCTIGLLVAKSGPDVSGSKNSARPVAVVHHLEPPGVSGGSVCPLSHHRGLGRAQRICVSRRLETPGLLRFRACHLGASPACSHEHPGVLPRQAPPAPRARARAARPGVFGSPGTCPRVWHRSHLKSNRYTKSVELRGLEPLASCMPSMANPSGAVA